MSLAEVLISRIREFEVQNAEYRRQIEEKAKDWVADTRKAAKTRGLL